MNWWLQDLYITCICSSGSSKIKGTASGIYPIPLQISGQYLYPSGSSSTSWGIYISPRKSRSLPGEYIYPPGSQLTSKSYLPLTPPSKGGEAGFTESEAEVAFEEIAAIL